MTLTAASRAAIDAFLYKVLAPDEREFIDSYFISDEVKIFDCSMDMPATWIVNCKAAYNLDISHRLHLPLWELVRWIEEQASHEQYTNQLDRKIAGA